MSMWFISVCTRCVCFWEYNAPSTTKGHLSRCFYKRVSVNEFRCYLKSIYLNPKQRNVNPMTHYNRWYHSTSPIWTVVDMCNSLLYLPNRQKRYAKKPEIRVRKELRTLTDRERRDYHRAIQLLKADTVSSFDCQLVKMKYRTYLYV